jgi:hypothetical protein
VQTGSQEGGSENHCRLPILFLTERNMSEVKGVFRGNRNGTATHQMRCCQLAQLVFHLELPYFSREEGVRDVEEV